MSPIPLIACTHSETLTSLSSWSNFVCASTFSFSSSSRCLATVSTFVWRSSISPFLCCINSCFVLMSSDSWAFSLEGEEQEGVKANESLKGITYHLQVPILRPIGQTQHPAPTQTHLNIMQKTESQPGCLSLENRYSLPHYMQRVPSVWHTSHLYLSTSLIHMWV